MTVLPLNRTEYRGPECGDSGGGQARAHTDRRDATAADHGREAPNAPSPASSGPRLPRPRGKSQSPIRSAAKRQTHPQSNGEQQVSSARLRSVTDGEPTDLASAQPPPGFVAARAIPAMPPPAREHARVA